MGSSPKGKTPCQAVLQRQPTSNKAQSSPTGIRSYSLRSAPEPWMGSSQSTVSQRGKWRAAQNEVHTDLHSLLHPHPPHQWQHQACADPGADITPRQAPESHRAAHRVRLRDVSVAHHLLHSPPSHHSRGTLPQKAVQVSGDIPISMASAHKASARWALREEEFR